MIPQQTNGTTAQFPLFSPQNPKSRRISKVRINPDGHTSRRHNTQSKIQFSQSGPIEKLNTLYSPNTTQGALSSKKLNNKLVDFQNNENENFNVSSWTNFEYNKLFPTSFRPNIPKSNLCPTKKKLQNTKIAVKSFLLPRNDRNIISIQIESNWENSDYITMNFISVLDKNDCQINSNYIEQEQIYIASIPEPSSLAKLEYLLDTSYSKDEKKIFNELFENKKFTIFLSIHKSIEISSVRIFNLPIKNQSAVKDVSIYLNDKLYTKGQIPQNFGVNLNIAYPSISHQEIVSTTDDSNQENSCLIPRMLAYSDKYGILPAKPITELRIEIIETYKSSTIINDSSINIHTNNYVGINGFDFIDISGNLILHIQEKSDNDIHYVKEVNIRGFSDLINCGMLLRKNKRTTKKEDMFLGVADSKLPPSFNFIFNQPICLSEVLVWNYNGYDGNLNHGIKKLKLYADNILMWVGKIPKGNGKFMMNFHTIQLFHSFNNITKTCV